MCDDLTLKKFKLGLYSIWKACFKFPVTLEPKLVTPQTQEATVTCI